MRVPSTAAYGPRPGAKQSTPVKIRTDNVEQELVAKFKAAQAKATKVGVENLTKEDIDGLAPHSSRSLGGTKHHRSFLVPLGIAPSGRRFTSR